MFGAKSLIHWIILGVVILLLFGGRNKISDLMGDIAKGIKSFKKGMAEDETASAAPTMPSETKSIERQPGAAPAETAGEVRKVG